MCEVPVFSDEQPLGTQQAHLVTDEVAFSVTASVHRPDVVLDHQRRFLHHTPLEGDPLDQSRSAERDRPDNYKMMGTK